MVRTPVCSRDGSRLGVCACTVRSHPGTIPRRLCVCMCVPPEPHPFNHCSRRHSQKRVRVVALLQARGSTMKGEPYAPIKSMRFWRANVGDAGAAAVVRPICRRHIQCVNIHSRLSLAAGAVIVGR